MKTVISRAMKKIFAAMGLMMAAIVSLVSCQPKEIFSETRTMTITASSDLTKTTNDGMSTLWAEGDQLHVFYSNGSTYEKAGVFTLSEGNGSVSATFTCESAKTPSGSATWYAIYSGASTAVPATPAGSADGDGYVFLGRSNGIDQPAYGDMSKVAASHCPMYGVAQNVSSGATPAFSMKQIASVIEFNVVNNTSGTLVVNSLQLVETVDIAGQYYLDVTSSEPVLTGVSGKTINNPLVRIKTPTELAAGASAKIYMPVKPFKHALTAGMEVVVSGSIGGKVGSKTFSLTPSTDAQATFVPGKIKTVTVNVTGLDVATESNTVKEVLNGDLNTDYLVENALVTLVYAKGFFVTDGTGTILVFTNDAPAVKKGDKVSISGQISTYSGMTQFNRPAVTVLSSNNNVSLSAVAWSKEEIDEASTDATCEYVSLESAAFSSATSAVLKDAAGNNSATISMTAATDPAVTLAKGTFDVTGYVYGCYKDKVYMYVDSAVEHQDTPPVVEGTEVSMTIKQYQEGHNCTLSAGSEVVKYKVLDLSSAVRMMTNGVSSNGGSFWTSGDNVQWRLYQGGPDNLTVKVASGCQLKSVKITYASQNGGVLVDGAGSKVESNMEVSASGTSVVFVVGNTAEEGANGQVRVTAVTIVYTGSGTLPPEPDEPAEEIETKITMAGNMTVYIGETGELNATSNVSGATINYSSEDTSIATVSSTGVVTGVSEGTVKVYARITGVSGQYTDAERYCNVTVSAKPTPTTGTWVETSLASISDGAQIVIVGKAGETLYAMANDKGTGSAPTAVVVSVSGTKLASAPASNLVWTLKKDTAGYKFNASDDNYLYATDSNNGLRVGTNTNNVFSLDSTGYLAIKINETTTRYVGVYTTNPDWRCYTSTTTNNIKGQTFTFYVKQ